MSAIEVPHDGRSGFDSGRLGIDIGFPDDFRRALCDVSSAEACLAFVDASTRADFFERARVDPTSVPLFTGLDHARGHFGIWVSKDSLRIDVAKLTAFEVYRISLETDFPMTCVPPAEVVERCALFNKEFERARKFADGRTANLFRALGRNRELIVPAEQDPSNHYPKQFHIRILAEIRSLRSE